MWKYVIVSVGFAAYAKNTWIQTGKLQMQKMQPGTITITVLAGTAFLTGVGASHLCANTICCLQIVYPGRMSIHIHLPVISGGKENTRMKL